MKKILKKNIKQRLLYKQLEKKRLILNAVKNNLHLPIFIRWKTQYHFHEISNKSCITQIKNRCILTGRAKSIYRKFKLSRLQLRLHISQGGLCGFSKVSW